MRDFHDDIFQMIEQCLCVFYDSIVVGLIATQKIEIARPESSFIENVLVREWTRSLKPIQSENVGLPGIGQPWNVTGS